MTDDIAALIDRLKGRIQRGPGHTGEDLDLMKDALSRLTTSPLPNEIAGLIKSIDHALVSNEDRKQRVLYHLKVALRALAQENERLKAEFAVAVKWHEQDAADYNELRDERDAIRAKTIEECAQVLEKRTYREERSRGGMGQIFGATQDQEAKDCAAAIRALAQTDESKTESGE